MAAEDPSVSGVSGRYATALFELARDQNAVDAVQADLDKFDALLNESADLKRLVRSPVFSAEVQSRALAVVLDQAGIAGISIPCGFSSSGLPIGLHLQAPPFEEERLLRGAHMFQQATDWHDRKPELG